MVTNTVMGWTLQGPTKEMKWQQDNATIAATLAQVCIIDNLTHERAETEIDKALGNHYQRNVNVLKDIHRKGYQDEANPFG